MLNFTKKTEYGIIALTGLVRNSDRPLNSRQISTEYGIPLPILSNILKELAKSGIVESLRGAKGGYRLKQNAEDLTLGRVLEVLEGKVRLTECMDVAEGEASDCSLQESCPVRAPLMRLQQKMKGWLDEVSLAEIAVEPDDPQEKGPKLHEVAHIYGQPIHHPG
ncbi:MAG: Rrf2 family transcriptional regulator [Planctomycetota bacterium]|jgi:Rrf2 family protein|nr:Rrf2 family transcriptional regulator [Planctomycetota bacterium]MDP7249414.1 Rrf2 family transcriptional regulator [Planctomycetota bacterium]